MPSARLVSAALLGGLSPVVADRCGRRSDHPYGSSSFSPMPTSLRPVCRPDQPGTSALRPSSAAAIVSGRPRRSCSISSNTVGSNASNQGVLFVELTDPNRQTLVSLPQAFQSPTTDASGYTPGSGFSSATLTLGIRGLDGDR